MTVEHKNGEQGQGHAGHDQANLEFVEGRRVLFFILPEVVFQEVGSLAQPEESLVVLHGQGGTGAGGDCPL